MRRKVFENVTVGLANSQKLLHNQDLECARNHHRSPIGSRLGWVKIRGW
jgi:hypothetical protein